MLIAIGGPTGSGKTTLAYNLKRNMPALRDAVILDGDQVRREILGYDLRYKMTDADYTDDISKRVRDKMDDRIREALLHGLTAIDAYGFWSEESRLAIENLALSSSAGFAGFWLNVPHEVLRQRITQRLAERKDLPTLNVEKGHASDACLGVLAKYAHMTENSPNSPNWHIVDGGLGENAVFELAVGVLKSL